MQADRLSAARDIGFDHFFRIDDTIEFGFRDKT
jgi:hypothetical protein